MRVLFNQWSTVGQKTGVGHCADQLLRHLRQLPAHSIQPIPSDRWVAMERCVSALRRRLRPFLPRGKGSRWLHPLAAFGVFRWAARWVRQTHDSWLERVQRQMLHNDHFDIYHEPNFLPLESSLKTVTTLHDLSVLLHPEWHPLSRIRSYEQAFPQTLRQTDHYITVSEFTRRQVQRHLYIPGNRVTCVHNAARPQFKPLPRKFVVETLQKNNLPLRYLLYVGTIEPRKNVLSLLQAYCSLPEPVRQSCPLVVAGQWGWSVEEVQRYYDEEGRHRGVRHIGYLADDIMPALYNGARALVYPSHYEGFGLPPLEMLACGGAVLASKIEAIIEVLGNRGHLIAPEDVEGWHHAMMRVMTDDDWRQEIRQGAEQAAEHFSWERAARETIEVYRKTLAFEKPGESPLRKTA